MSCVYLRRFPIRALLNFGFFSIEITSARSWDLTVPSSRFTITRISPSAKIGNSRGSLVWFRFDRGRRVILFAMSHLYTSNARREGVRCTELSSAGLKRCGPFTRGSVGAFEAKRRLHLMQADG